MLTSKFATRASRLFSQSIGLKLQLALAAIERHPTTLNPALVFGARYFSFKASEAKLFQNIYGIVEQRILEGMFFHSINICGNN